MRLRILLVDDEQLALDKLATMLGQISDVEVVGTAGDGVEAAAAIARTRPDLVLLDIQMPERSGLSLAADLPAGDRPEIIFVTAFEQFAADAFEVDATDYLLKPVRFDRLRQAIERARRRLDRHKHEAVQTVAPEIAGEGGFDDAIWVQVRGGTRRVAITSIDRIEAARDYVMLYTRERTYIHRTTMSALQRRIDPAELIRIHRSAFIRPCRVVEFTKLPSGSMTIELDDGACLPVGPNYAGELLLRLGLCSVQRG